MNRRSLLVLLAAGLLLGGGSAAALAQEQLLGGKLRAGDEVLVSAGETVDGDLYASGGSVRVEGTVEGDLVATGGQVVVSGHVTGDLMAGSGTVSISGRIGGDARVGAGRVTVSGSVGEDLVAGSGRVTITSSGVVGEDLIFGTGQTTLDGRVEGDVLGMTGSYERRGQVGGTEDVTIRGRAPEQAPTAADRVLGAVRRFLGLLGVGAALLWLLPWTVEGAADTVRRRPLASLGVGVLGFAGSFVLVLGLILVAALVGLGLGLLTLGGVVGLVVLTTIVLLVLLAFLLFLVVAFVAPAAVGLALGRLALGDRGSALRWGPLALGVLVVVVLTSLPTAGGWFSFLVAVLGLGALLLGWVARRRGTRVPEPAAPPAA